VDEGDVKSFIHNLFFHQNSNIHFNYFAIRISKLAHQQII